MTRLMHSSRSGVVSGQHALLLDEPPVPAAPPAHVLAPAATLLTPLAADVSALEHVLEDSEALVRQGWTIAAALNEVRRHCPRCESIGVLAESAGTLQGVLNRCRQNLRVAEKAVSNIRAAVSAGRDQP